MSVSMACSDGDGASLLLLLLGLAHASSQVSEVAAFFSSELCEGALFNNLAILNDSEAVAPFNCCKPMSNYNGRAVLHDLVEGFLH